MNFYEHHLGDYMRDTAHLSLLEDGAYRRLLDAYYVREKPLPADARDCCKLARATSKAERDAVAYVLREFFELRDDGHHQARADAEIQRYQDKRSKAAGSANARWEAMRTTSERNANAYANASTDAMRTHSERNANGDANGMPHASAPVAHPGTGAHPSPVPSPQSPSSEAKLPRLSARAVRLPTDWEPGESGTAYAASHGLANGRVAGELEKFRDYWAAEGGAKARKVDWQAAWRTWVRNAVAFAGNGRRESGGNDVFAGTR